jgi:hypothetical protein
MRIKELTESFNKCYDMACKMYDYAKAKNLHPKLIQVADYKGDGSGADKRWQKLPQRVWQHYVTVIGNKVYDPTAKQFGPDNDTEYSLERLDADWGQQYLIK